MCELNTAYAIMSNEWHGRTNHLFGRRFWSELITKNSHLLWATRYVVQNPVRAGLCDTCEDWKWSSYRATIGLAVPPPYLAVEDVLKFVASGPGDPMTHYREYCGTVVPKRPVRSRHAR